jgi:hypothetical protein
MASNILYYITVTSRTGDYMLHTEALLPVNKPNHDDWIKSAWDLEHYIVQYTTIKPNNWGKLFK